VGAGSGERALQLLSEQEFAAALVDKNLGRASTEWKSCATSAGGSRAAPASS